MNTGEIAALRMQLVLGGFWPLRLNGKIPFLEAEAASDRLKQIASFALTTGKAKLTTRDLTRNVPSLRGKTVFKINELVSPLVAGGWLQPVERFPTNKAWTVSPLVVTQFAARRTIEDAAAQGQARRAI
jgi:hypothetical protein